MISRRSSPESTPFFVQTLLLLFLLLQGAQAERTLGIAVSPSSQDYGTALSEAVKAGSQVFEIPQQWRESNEPQNRRLLSQFDSLLPAHDLSVVLSLNPLDTLNNQIPDDLKGTPYNEPEFVKRYLRFVDSTLASVTNCDLHSISVGNEVDILLGDDEELWSQYTDFFVQAKKHLERVRPGVPVGVKISFEAFQKKRALVEPIIRASDRVMVTYYPVREGRVKGPKIPIAEFKVLAQAYPQKKIQISELGYPSSRVLGSSEVLQAEFVSAAFEAWDENPQIVLLNFVWLNDITPGSKASLNKQFQNPYLVELLSSLGLRTHDGVPKPGFLRLLQNARRRDLAR